MAESKITLGDLDANLARHESRVFIRTLLLVLIPVVAAIAWLWVTVSAVGDAKSELKSVSTNLEVAEQDLTEVRVDLERTKMDVAGAIEAKNVAIADLEETSVALNSEKQAATDAKKLADAAKEAERAAIAARENAQRALTNMESDLANATKQNEDAMANLNRTNLALQAAEEAEKQARTAKDTAETQLKSSRAELESAVALRTTVEADLKQTRLQLASTKNEKLQFENDIKIYKTQIGNYQKSATAYQKEINVLREKLKTNQLHLAELQASVCASAKFDEHRYKLNWSNTKELSSRLRGGGQLLMQISELQRRNVGWDWANTPERGFTSPGFAEHILKKKLSDLDRIERPRTGDLIVYEKGFHMFYFEISRGERFVVGMTPAGIASLKPEFGPKRLHALKTGLAN